MTAQESFVDLVFEGGGVKGIGLAGAHAALRRAGYVPRSVAGASAGAITAALVAAGYDDAELGAVLADIPFARFKDKDLIDRVPVAGMVASLLSQLGIYEGEVFRDWIAGLLAAKGVTRFGDLVDEAAEDPAQRWRLRVIASDLTTRRLLVLPNDAHHLGADPDELDIAYAVRMSMSIPVFFEPVRHRNPQTGREHVIVDGGMLSNFPVWLFDRRTGEPRWPTFGLLLVEPEPHLDLGRRLEEDVDTRVGIVDFVKSLAGTMMAAHDRLYLENASYARTIPIPTLGVGTTEFGITPDRVAALYASGERAAERFLESWDFQAYIESFRQGRPQPSRRDTLTGQGA